MQCMNHSCNVVNQVLGGVRRTRTDTRSRITFGTIPGTRSATRSDYEMGTQQIRNLCTFSTCLCMHFYLWTMLYHMNGLECATHEPLLANQHATFFCCRWTNTCLFFAGFVLSNWYQFEKAIPIHTCQNNWELIALNGGQTRSIGHKAALSFESLVGRSPNILWFPIYVGSTVHIPVLSVFQVKVTLGLGGKRGQGWSLISPRYCKQRTSA